MDEQLHDCPFCGGSGALWYDGRVDDGHPADNSWYVICNLCGAQTTKRASASAAIESWNRRTEATQ